MAERELSTQRKSDLLLGGLALASILVHLALPASRARLSRGVSSGYCGRVKNPQVAAGVDGRDRQRSWS